MPKNIFGDDAVSAPTAGKNIFGDAAVGAAPTGPIAPLPTIKPKALGVIQNDMSSLQTKGYSPLSQ